MESNYEGYVFGRLIVRLDLGVINNESKTYKVRMVMAECLNCSSGVKRQILANLKSGRSKSCGCLQKEIASKMLRQHGKSHTSTYRIWLSMNRRCENENHVAYKNYGGRGITVCPRWKESFENFLEDMGERPANMQIDRINNNKGYFLENCRWATVSENNFNRRVQENNKSGKTGVFWDKKRNKWCAQIIKNSKNYFVGRFENFDEAVEARKQAEIQFFGHTKD